MAKNKNAILIALFLMFAMASSIVALPPANAHDPPWEVPTWCYIAVTNNPVGVDQTTFIFFWLNTFPRTAVGAYGDRWTFTVEVTKPDESKETLGPYTSDPVGTASVSYTPNQVGTYTFVAKFEEHTLTGEPFPPGTSGLYFGTDFVNDTYLASNSDPYYLTVQEEPILKWPETPLPTEYWARPINTMNRDWYVLAANWLAGAAQNVGPTRNFNYGTAPESAHVMWATPMWTGGIMDARFGDIGYQTTHYSGLSFSPPIILNGKLYYNIQSHPREGWRVLDLYTGEELWFHNTTGPVTGVLGTQEKSGPVFDPEGSIAGESLAFGQIYNYESPNQHGGFPYLWSTNGPKPNTWMMFDAFTGNYICSIENVPSGGTAVYGKDGSILRYNIVGRGADKYLTVWNTSQAIWYRKIWNTNQYWMWRPYLNYTFGGIYGYSLNVSIPDVQGSIYAVREDQFVIGGTSGKNNGTYVQEGNLWALNLNRSKGAEGKLLWNFTFTPPLGVPDAAEGLMGAGKMTGPSVDPEDGVFLFEQSITRERWGYSLETGKKLWGPTEPEASLNYYGMDDVIYQGKLFSYGYSGEIIAYNITTGEVLWKYIASQEGFESPYGNYPLSLACVADGKLYMYSTEHSPTQPLWRGSYVRCINASNGAELWKINHFGSVIAADGYLVGWNAYDNQIYCYGKGPSVTTVEAPLTTIAEGESVEIRGSVTDQSAGAKAKVENGELNVVPAISDESMSAWMEYVYMQQPRPINATGIEVVLETLDPNGNFYEIGRTTSDTSGNYGLLWEPPVPGEYQIIATFHGSAAYGPSHATTYIGVSEAPQAAPTPTPPPPSMADMYIVPSVIGIIIAIIAVGLVIVLMLRKR